MMGQGCNPQSSQLQPRQKYLKKERQSLLTKSAREWASQIITKTPHKYLKEKKF